MNFQINLKNRKINPVKYKYISNILIRARTLIKVGDLNNKQMKNISSKSK
jgi:hypothetical protein